MYIPNYIPEPDAIPENVTKERYADRLRFIRKVWWRFIGSIALLSVLTWLIPEVELWKATVLFAATVLLISAHRTIYRNHRSEAKWASWFAVPILCAAAVFAKSLLGLMFPVWSILIGILCFSLYVRLCGRDFSFVGGYVLSLIVSSVLIATTFVAGNMYGSRNLEALLWNGGGLLYLVYNLASLLSRRRITEASAAVTDLYRDWMNPLGYSVRLVKHWRRHRILNDFSFEIAPK